eukprot:815136-Alexandrium_andersonii.AAC.1
MAEKALPAPLGPIHAGEPVQDPKRPKQPGELGGHKADQPPDAEGAEETELARPNDGQGGGLSRRPQAQPAAQA